MSTPTAPGVLSITVQSFPATEGMPYDGPVATFTDSNSNDVAGNFTATINWGDGSATSVGAITQPGGAGTPFVVSGSHTYDSPGGYPLMVTIHNVAAHTDTMGNVDISQDPNYQGEGTIALDPANPNLLFAASNQDVPGVIPGIFAAYSTDGGLTWTRRTLGTGPTGDGLPLSFTDPEAAFDQYGNLFLTYIDPSPGNTVNVLLSTDGGQTFRLLTSVTDQNNPGGVDQTKVTTGPGLDGADGSVWVSYLDTSQMIATISAAVTGLNQIGTFSAPQEVPGSSGGNYDCVSIGPSGQALVSWQDNPAGAGPAQIYDNLDIAGPGAGTNGWGPVAQKVTTTNVGGMYPIPPQQTRTIDSEPKVAFDDSGDQYEGRVYLSYTDAPSSGSPDTVVNLIYSDDDGVTWSDPIAVDPGENSQFLPSIAVDPVTGNVAVSWYDARNDPNGTGVQFFAAVSNNGGTSFLAGSPISDGTSNAATIPGGSFEALNQFGDYTTTTFVNGVFYPIWTDNSPALVGNPNVPQMDVATQRVVVEQVSRAPLVITVQTLPLVEGMPFSGTVATFTDANPKYVPSDFTATIDWGDGTTTDGTVGEQAGSFIVTGSHTYAEYGGYPLTVTIQDAADNIDTVGNVDVSQDPGYQAYETIAADPLNPDILFAASLNAASTTAATGLFAAYSTDGGVTWTTSLIATAAGRRRARRHVRPVRQPVSHIRRLDRHIGGRLAQHRRRLFLQDAYQYFRRQRGRHPPQSRDRARRTGRRRQRLGFVLRFEQCDRDHRRVHLWARCGRAIRLASGSQRVGGHPAQQRHRGFDRRRAKRHRSRRLAGQLHRCWSGHNLRERGHRQPRARRLGPDLGGDNHERRGLGSDPGRITSPSTHPRRLRGTPAAANTPAGCI